MTPLLQHASLSPAGRLPAGDPRVWAQSLTDLVAGVATTNGFGRVAEHDGPTLTAEAVEEAFGRLVATGVEHGDVVIVEGRNTVAACAWLLAVWLRGAVACPVDPDSPETTRDMIVLASGAQAVAGEDGSLRPVLRDRPAPLIRLHRPRRTTGGDLALMVFTSGSSGAPKGVMLTHAAVMSALRAIAGYLRIDASDRILTIPPLFFDYGLYQLLLSLFTGAALILNGKRTGAVAVAQLVDAARPTVLPVVPALASAIARIMEAGGRVNDAVRLVTNTGGHLSDSAIAALEARLPAARIVPMYGLTESKRALWLDRERWPHAAGSVGVAMPGLAACVAVEGPDGLREAAPGETGELMVRGGSVMQGYVGGESTGARLIPGRWRDDNWLATGDLFSVDADGLHWFRGRAKALIKQGGFCLCPREIEALAEGVDGVAEAAVVARMEESGDESAVLFLHPSAPLDAAGRKALAAAVAAAIPRTLRPRATAFVEAWPATPNGKIDRAALAAMARDAR